MKPRLLQLFSLLMLATTSLPVVVPASLLLSKGIARMEMEEKLEREKSLTIRVSKQDIHWIDAGECMINGRMFDVKNSKEEETLFILEGIFDDTETQIEEELADHANRDEQGEGSTFYKFKQIEARESLVTNLPLCVDLSRPASFNLNPEPFRSSHSQTPTPPPERMDLV